MALNVGALHIKANDCFVRLICAFGYVGRQWLQHGYFLFLMPKVPLALILQALAALYLIAFLGG